MNEQELSAFLKPWMRRLRLSAFFRALLTGFAAGLTAFAVTCVILRLTRQSGWLWPAGIGCGVLVLTGAFAWRMLRPTQETVTRELDALGLRERAATMLALRQDASEMARLQREDALRHIDPISPGRLKSRIGWVLPMLLAAALLLACGSVLAPKAWFESVLPVQAEGVLSEELLAMLREEQQSLEARGETALSDEMGGLVESLTSAGSELATAGLISEAQSAVQNAAASGEASESAAAEAQQALQQALESLTGEASQEASESGEGTEDEAGEGEAAEGEPQDGEGEQPEGEQSGEEQSQSGQPGQQGEGQPQNQSHGGSGEESTTNMTEPVYDPISGSVQYGEVFSAYYAEYLQDARSGSVPGDLQNAADTYFDSLNQ